MSKTTENYVNKPNMASLLAKIDTKMNNRYTKNEIDEYIPKTFVGTTAEWNSLSAAVKANYTLVTLTDDFVNAGVVSQLEAEIATKQDALTFDSTPTNESNNPVKSGGVYSALSNKSNNMKTITVLVETPDVINIGNNKYGVLAASFKNVLNNTFKIDTSKPLFIASWGYPENFASTIIFNYDDALNTDPYGAHMTGCIYNTYGDIWYFTNKHYIICVGGTNVRTTFKITGFSL